MEERLGSFARRVAFQFPGKEGDDFDLDGEVAGATLRNGFSAAVMTDATALQRFERDPIAKSLPPPSSLLRHARVVSSKSLG